MPSKTHVYYTWFICFQMNTMDDFEIKKMGGRQIMKASPIVQFKKVILLLKFFQIEFLHLF
jgi:hypothetical protein